MLREKTYKYRIYPTDEQKKYFANVFGCTRFLYNKMLSDKIDYYQTEKKTLKTYPASYKETFNFLKTVDSLALSNVQLQLEKAYKRFFEELKKKGKIEYKKKSLRKKAINPTYVLTEKDIKGFPRFKTKKNEVNTFTTNNQIKTNEKTKKITKTIRLEENKLYIPKLKTGIRTTIDRPLQDNTEIKNITISKTKTNKYFISILVLENIEEKPVSTTKVGIDLGIKVYLTLSNGKTYENIKTLAKYEQKIKKTQKALDRKVYDSNNYKKNQLKLAKLHEKVANIRKDHINKITSEIINENQVINIETLKIKNMIQNKRLAKHIQDAAWGQLINQLEYKASWYGRTLNKVDTFFASSQLCSVCGYKNKLIKDLKIREWECPNCKTVHDRDHNASVNIVNAI